MPTISYAQQPFVVQQASCHPHCQPSEGDIVQWTVTEVPAHKSVSASCQSTTGGNECAFNHVVKLQDNGNTVDVSYFSRTVSVYVTITAI